MSAGWKHGDSLDEQAKTHPLLKPYKSLSEKVWICLHSCCYWTVAQSPKKPRITLVSFLSVILIQSKTIYILGEILKNTSLTAGHEKLSSSFFFCSWDHSYWFCAVLKSNLFVLKYLYYFLRQKFSSSKSIYKWYQRCNEWGKIECFCSLFFHNQLL